MYHDIQARAARSNRDDAVDANPAGSPAAISAPHGEDEYGGAGFGTGRRLPQMPTSGLAPPQPPEPITPVAANPIASAPQYAQAQGPGMLAVERPRLVDRAGFHNLAGDPHLDAIMIWNQNYDGETDPWKYQVYDPEKHGPRHEEPPVRDVWWNPDDWRRKVIEILELMQQAWEFHKQRNPRRHGPRTGGRT